MPSAQLYPALFVTHGAGPLPVLNRPGHVHMAEAWKQHVDDIIDRYGKPRAIAVVSAHYRTAAPAAGSGEHPSMLYDYGGFPKEAYQLQYPAPGAPELAEQMVAKLCEAGFKATADPQRKYDHGVFVPLLATFPNADIPVVPVSVLFSDDPAEHIRIGQALRQFREQGVFFLGSGSTFHHSANYDIPGAGGRLGDALTAVLANKTLSPEQRLEKIAGVESFDGFAEAQPPGSHEHLMPLLTLVGTSNGAPAREIASIPFSQADTRHFLFEE